MVDVLTSVAEFIDQDQIIEEIATAQARQTGSGLWRVDEDCFGYTLDQLHEEVEERLGVNTTPWATVHYPGAGQVLMHSHNKWETAIWYPEDHTCGLLLTDDFYLPVANELVLLEAGAKHGIEANNSDRPRYSVVFTYAT